LQGLISPTNLRTAYTRVAPKKVRIQSSHQYLLTLLGSTRAKAARKMLMKLTPGVGLYVGRLVREYIGYVIFWQKNIGAKVARKILVKLF